MPGKEADLLKKYNERWGNPGEFLWRNTRPEEGNWENRNAVLSRKYLEARERLFRERLFPEQLGAEILELLRPLGMRAANTSRSSRRGSCKRYVAPTFQEPDLTGLRENTEESWQQTHCQDQECLLKREEQPCHLRSSKSVQLWGFRSKKLKGKEENKKHCVSPKQMKVISIKPGDSSGHHANF